MREQACHFIISWPEILDYIGSRGDMEEWASVPIGSLWDGMKPLVSLMTTERTSRRQEQEFTMVLEKVCFAN
jgi:hypothetical protein